MTLHILGSSSRGNGYLLTAADGETLIIEAGVPFLDIKRALAFNLDRIVGALVSHRHGDHAHSLPDMARAGIDVHTSADVMAAQDFDVQPLLTETQPRQWTLVGGAFEVMALPVTHDVPCQAFIVRHPEMGKLLFVTDSVSFPYKVQGLDHVLIEANYSDRLLEENIAAGRVPAAMRDRLLTSHMELSATLRTLDAQDLTRVREIVLLHLSGDNADGAEFQRRVAAHTGLPVYIAAPGLSLDVSLV